MSSVPKEHDYIGLSETPSMERVSDKLSSTGSTSSTLSIEENNNSSSNNNNNSASLKPKITSSLNLKETELRLGLPGSLSPERKPQPTGVSLFGKDIDTNANTTTTTNNGYSLSPLKSFVSGAKRGFSDAIDVSSSKWVFSVGNGSEADFGKGAVLFSPRGDNGNTQKSGVPGGVGKKDAGVGGGVVTQSSKPVQEKNNQESGGANENSSAPAANYTTGIWKFTGQCGSHGLRGREGLNESSLRDLLHGSEYVLTYEDKDGDWMLVGDVPWEMFTDSCRRLRIMKGSEAIGLGK
ncbi:hypothetical protein Tsubulata_038267 [Turnera subulata]|uniref:Auxin-responsive protein n=1 Tax=Turnera subulata TaxID=218843 RepID=A0A9Q0J7Y7_9ROSI|nr:hypothetical protein Tsubulata_038267 [Turnera subulata]